MSVTMVALDDILPNRYRNMEHYEIQEDKITALLESYANSGFWDGSIQARPHPKRAGKYEIAFGHHRVEAARRAAKTKPEFRELGLVIAPRSNEDMLRMMADENRADFKHDSRVSIETIGAVIEAYGRGEITLEAPPTTERGSAGTQVYGLPGGKPYTLATVARFLGWTKPSDGQANNECRAAFVAYQKRATVGEAIDSLPSDKRSQTAIDSITQAARSAQVAAVEAGFTPAKIVRAEKQAARAMAKEIADQGNFKVRDMAVSLGKQAVREVAGPKTKKTPEIEIYTARLIRKCETCEPYSDILAECRRLVPFVDDLTPTLARKLADSLEDMLKRSERGVRSLAAVLRSSNPKKFVALLPEKAS